MATITIDRDHGDAVYVQVARQVRHLVSTGVLAAGTPLPTVRQLSRDLGVSLNTVARAYRLLESEGFLVIRERTGVTVAEPAATVDEAAHQAMVGELQIVLAKLRQAGIPKEELLKTVREQIELLEGSGGAGR